MGGGAGAGSQAQGDGAHERGRQSLAGMSAMVLFQAGCPIRELVAAYGASAVVAIQEVPIDI